MIKKKLISSYSIPVNKAIHLISVSDETEPVGSFAYKLLYPGDIDIREQIKESGSKSHALLKIAQDIQNIVRKVISHPGYFLAEFKAGLDHRYPKDQSLYIVRWNESDILKGYKMLPGNIILPLEKALEDQTIVKIDIWAPINGRYVELSNFMILVYENEMGQQIPINGPQPDYIESIKKDVRTYLSKNTLNVFKASKRMLLLAKAYNDNVMLGKILPLINSGAGLLYQVVSDMNTISDMVNKLQNRSPYEFIFKEIDNFKDRLSYISEFDIDDQKVNMHINNIVQNKFIGINLIDELDKLLAYLLQILNNVSFDYDTIYGVLPPPLGYD